MKMELNNYIELCKRTWRFQSTQMDIRHCLLGIASEAGELQSCIKKNVGYGRDIDTVNVMEECGDLLYFNLRLYDILFPKNIRDIHNDYLLNRVTWNANALSIEIGTYDIQKTTGELYFDLVSREDFTEESMDKYHNKILENIDQVISVLKFFKFDLELTMKANIDKLAKRYPEKFDDFLAFHRNLDVERESLENNAKV